MTTSQTIGETIRAGRETMRMSQRALATKIGVTSAYICLLEQGKRDASLTTIQKLATALDTTFWLRIDPKGANDE